MPPKRVQIEHAPVVARFSAALRARRLSLGLTQAQLAERATVSVNYMTRLEGGTVAPGIDLLERLAVALGTTSADLLPPGDAPNEQLVLKKEAQRLFKGIMDTADAGTLRALVYLLSRLADEPVGRG